MASDLEKIIAEIDSLFAQATFPVVKQALKELKLKQQSLLDHTKFQEAASSAPSKPSHSSISRPLTKLTTYAYDESDKFVKLYYTLNGVQNLPAENVKSCFTDDSFDITVIDLDGKDYSISARGFVHPIDAENSVVKQKSDMLLVMLKKSKAGTWSELLKIVQSKKEAAKLKDADPGMDASDPQAGLMNMMKKLYEEGDDETKRSLRKAWHESQNKKGGGGLGGGFGGGDMPGMPDLDF
uniref:Calcyclin-binding protein n=1 Tax=Panagrolaimus sp. ES5 TaxID=591445 RepID=A0AC34GR69_9BILA